MLLKKGFVITDKLLEIIREDIKRFEQTPIEEECDTYQALVGKYNGIFENFEEEIPQIIKSSSFGEYVSYKSELNAIKEKLEIFLAIAKKNDPLYEFKMMLNEDLIKLKEAIDDKKNEKTTELFKFSLYKEITAKYHPYVLKLSDGLYNYINSYSFYDEVKGISLFHNLSQVYNKLKSFKALGYPSINEALPLQTTPIVQITNTNQNEVNQNVTFNSIREKIENMSVLTYKEIEENLKKLEELELIIKSNEKKSKKWEQAKDIIRWIADKGVDVGITFLPLLLQIK